MVTKSSNLMQVSEMILKSPLRAVGKLFKGDYGSVSGFLMEVEKELTTLNIGFKQNASLSVYYDSPLKKTPETLISFHGLFLPEITAATPLSYTEIIIDGKVLYIKVPGNVIKNIFDGYEALFDYVIKNNVNLKSEAGYQVSIFDEGILSTEIYMEII